MMSLSSPRPPSLHKNNGARNGVNNLTEVKLTWKRLLLLVPLLVPLLAPGAAPGAALEDPHAAKERSSEFITQHRGQWRLYCDRNIYFTVTTECVSVFVCF